MRSVSKDMEKLEPSYAAGENVKGFGSFGKGLAVPPRPPQN